MLPSQIVNASMSRRDDTEAKVYVGDLAQDCTEKDLERAFSYYGHLKKVWVARNPPGFAFIEFEDYRDADDAVEGLDGTTLCGSRVRVEHSTGKSRPKPWGGDRGGRGGDRGGPRRMGDDKCYECGERGHFARECTRRGGGGGGGGGGGRRGGGRSRSRSRSSSYDRGGRGAARRSYSRSKSRDRSYSRSPRM